jgi:nucleolar protein 4
MPKSTENTIFVRFIPTPAHKVLRHQLEHIFSQTGPIKKSSWIHSQQNDTSKGYGFVKYVSHEDAEAASKELNNTHIQMEGEQYLLKVELASLQVESKGHHSEQSNEEPQESHHALVVGDDSTELKKKSRIILRNVSFYAKEQDIKKATEKAFGSVTEVHLPRVQSNLHVGFCFVTFADPTDAKKAVDAKTLIIKKRPASIDWSIPKKLHQQKHRGDEPIESQDDKKGKNQIEGDENFDEESIIGSESGSVSSSHHDGSTDGSEDQEEDQEEDPLDDSLRQKRTLFLRNLPFDTTRHDLFKLLSRFGHIQSIYLVRDKSTEMLKGTAFVTFTKAQSAERTIQNALSDASSFLSQRDTTTASDGRTDATKPGASSLLLNGRKILIDYAVDKETALTFDSKEHSIPSADRRNMYLQAEARVESSSSDPNANNKNTWDDLPDQDQKKRQNALKDKTTKLQSPIFFINPNRLSIRNLAKEVDEASLQLLCKDATIRGLEKRLVGAKDQIAHWRALGELSTRDILSKVQNHEENGEDIIPSWDPKASLKDYLPSVYIDRDFGPTGNKSNAPSRGFGFVEFKCHAHALACLRELNNNPSYSGEFVAGGSSADSLKKKKGKKGKAAGTKGSGGGAFVGEDGRVRVPRLVVDFVVGFCLPRWLNLC